MTLTGMPALRAVAAKRSASASSVMAPIATAAPAKSPACQARAVIEIAPCGNVGGERAQLFAGRLADDVHMGAGGRQQFGLPRRGHRISAHQRPLALEGRGTPAAATARASAGSSPRDGGTRAPRDGAASAQPSDGLVEPAQTLGIARHGTPFVDARPRVPRRAAHPIEQALCQRRARQAEWVKTAVTGTPRCLVGQDGGRMFNS